MLQSSRLEDHMKTIGIDQSSYARSSFEHRCINKTKKIYQHAGKCDDQQNLKYIIDAAIISNPDGVTDHSPNVHMTSAPVKKPSARKSLCLFTNILDVKPTTAKRSFVAAESRRKSMKVCNSLCKNKKGHSKINEQIKRNLYTWMTRHPQVVQSPISNDCLKVVLDDQKEPQIDPNVLLRVSVRELHNSLVSDPNDGGLKDARDYDVKIIISDSTLHSLLPPKLKQISALTL